MYLVCLCTPEKQLQWIFLDGNKKSVNDGYGTWLLVKGKLELLFMMPYVTAYYRPHVHDFVSIVKTRNIKVIFYEELNTIII